jgi:hypothetical protein
MKLLPKIYGQNNYPLHRGSNYRVVDIKTSNNGYLITKLSDFASVQKIKLVYNKNGFSKATVKVNTNYRTPYSYTLYFDNKGNEIISKDNSDSKERKMWLDLQKD